MSEKQQKPVKEVQVPDYKRSPERKWKRCPKCKAEVFVEANGKEYYHVITCPKGNGINYRR